MRRFIGVLAGFVVIALAASVCYADDSDGDSDGIRFSLNIGELLGTLAQSEEEMAKIKINGWGQLRYSYSSGTYDFAEQRPRGGNESFDVWRFRLLPEVAYRSMTFGCQYETEPYSILLDFYVNVDISESSDAFQFKCGQFIPPFGWARACSPYKLITNYPQVVRYLFGGSDPYLPTDYFMRDNGVMMHGSTELGEEYSDFRPRLSYAVGFFNGDSPDSPNSDMYWTFFYTVKLQATEDVTFGFSYEDGSRAGTVLGTDFERQINRDRVGMCWRFTLDNLLVEGEYIWASDNPSDFDKHQIDQSHHNKRQQVEGLYLNFGLWLKKDKVRLVGKADWLKMPAYYVDTNTRTNEHDFPDRTKRKYALGAVFNINKHCRIKLFWEQTQDEGRANYPRISGSEHRGYVELGVSF